MLIALTIPGLTMDRTLFNTAKYHVEGAVQAAQISSGILQEELFTPYHVAGSPALPIPDRATLVLPTDTERQECPGQVFQTVVLPPSREAVSRAGKRFTVNARQASFIGMVSDNVLTILDGPPGTGKTRTLLPLIDAWASNAPNGWCVVVVAASNAALDHLCYLLWRASQAGLLSFELAKVLRFARISALHRDY